MLTGETLTEEYERTHLESRKLHEQAAELFAGNGVTHASRFLNPFRPYITHAKGSRKWDVDGNEYIDYMMGHGALILGHSHPAVVQAVKEQMSKGVHYGENHHLEVDWAKLIKSMMSIAERVEFCASGTEANLLAIRLARAFTGRKKVLRFEENFHGWASEAAPSGSAGIVTPEVNIIPMNNLNKVEDELSKKEYAILLTEGGGASMDGQVPIEINFVRALEDLTRKYGTIWAIDEVVTGFRDAPGGWQSTVGVTPDLTTLGKCVGGGLPCGAVVGRANIMEVLNQNNPPQSRVRHSGTFNANPLLCAAGIAACKLYLSGEPQKKAREMADYFRQKGNKLLKERSISGRLYGRTIVHFYLGSIEYEPADETLPPTKDFSKLMNRANSATMIRLTQHLLQRGVANFSQGFFVLSAAHTKKDIEQTMQVFGDSLDSMIAEGTMSRSGA